MKYEWMDEYLMQKRGVMRDLQENWNWMRYKLGDKMFAASCRNDDNEPYYITLKTEPADGEFLRKQYEDIIPGYYMNKEHWISVKVDGDVSDELLKELLDKAYQAMLGSFSGKKQREILGLSCCGTECETCYCYGEMCMGCNELRGKPFHSPKEACSIYRCSVNKKKYATCASCEKLPCDIWRATKDPSFSDEEFEANIRERVKNLHFGREEKTDGE